MRIVDIRETAIPLKSDLRNSGFDFSEMTTSVVAVITDVMTWIQKDGMVADDGKEYRAGPYTYVDFTNEEMLKSAIAIGPVNLGMDANYLPSGAGNPSGWYVFGGSPGNPSPNHCTRLCGYGPAADCFKAIDMVYGTTTPVPAGAPATLYLG